MIKYNDQKKYYEANKDKIMEKQRQYREKKRSKKVETTSKTVNQSVQTVINPQIINECIEYSIIHHGRLNKVLHQFLKKVNFIKWKWMMDKVLDEYEDRVTEYFKYKEVRNTLTIGNKYFLQIKDEENEIRNVPLFFVLKDKIKEGIEVVSYASYTKLSPKGKVIYEADYTDEVEELFIGNESLRLVIPHDVSTALPDKFKVNTQVVNNKNKSPPTFWKIKEIFTDSICIEQYKTSTGRDSNGMNVFTSFFEEGMSDKCISFDTFIQEYDVHDATKKYTDNTPFQRFIL